MASKYPMRLDVARARLSALGITQLALAKECDVDVRTVQRWFAGQPVRLDEAERVAAALSMGTAEVFEGVPDENLSVKLGRIGPLHRALISRDGTIAQMLRIVSMHHAADLIEPVSFRSHPARGYVYTIEHRPHMRHGFLRVRVGCPARSSLLRVIHRVSRSVCYERARVSLWPDRARLVENHYVRSVSSARRADGSIDLWAWTGVDVEALIVVGEVELTVEVLPPARDRTVFDMALDETSHAVCIRPSFGQLVAADLPHGYDRISHRDGARTDGPESEAC